MPIAVRDAAFVVVDVVGLQYIMGSGMHSLIVNAVGVDIIVGPVMHALVPLYAVNYGVAVLSYFQQTLLLWMRS